MATITQEGVMMAHEYPRIGRMDKHDKNICARCRCGEIGKRKVHIQLSIFRGEDEVVWACMEHRNDPEYLLGWND